MTVEDLLVDKDISFIPKGKDFLVKCLNPEHEDRNPSMRIDQITGIFNCFSCQYKGNLFNLFGEKANQLQIRRELVKKKIKNKRTETIGLSFPPNSVPYVGNWRSIKPETYEKFEAFQNSDAAYISRILFPIRDITGKIVAFNGRHTAAGIPKYMIYPAQAKMPLFPIVTPLKGSVVLVEGIFDMINLHDKGLTNAVCCFGTKNINEEKLGMLSVQGITSVDIFFDGDEAGQSASQAVKGMCEKVGLLTRNVFLKDTDPGALTEPQIQNLKRKLYG